MSKTVWQYYLDTTRKIHDRALAGVDTLEKWEAGREELQKQFFRSLGLDQPPPKCDLKVQKHGRLTGDGFRAEKISFQLLPDCWGTAIIFYPDPLPKEKAPAVLYCCGHAKVGVHGHAGQGAMWAQRGYVCLVLDTIEQHDNPGTHQGLGPKLRYDWVSMGYTSGGGELWNTIRALDLLCGLPEVDAKRIGSTGTSGGGTLSFLIGVADSRIAAVASACGVTTSHFSLLNRNFLGHCDCMFVQNVHRRDTSEFAGLLAPRPLLFCYGDDDALFSKAEYHGMAEKVRQVYRLYDAEARFELFTYPGPHGYVPESVDRINRWFDAHLVGEERPLLQPKKPLVPEVETGIFHGTPPSPNRTFLLPELLSPRGSVALPQRPGEWESIRRKTVERLRREVFQAVYDEDAEVSFETVGDWTLGRIGRWRRHRGNIDGVEIWLEEKIREGDGDVLFIGVANHDENAMSMTHKAADFVANRSALLVEPRGAGTSSTRSTVMSVDRDNYLLQAGNLAGIAPLVLIIQDLYHTVRFLRSRKETAGKRLFLYGTGEAAVACLYYGILDEEIEGVLAEQPPGSHLSGGYIPGIMRVLEFEQACGMLAPRPIALVDQPPDKQNWGMRLYERLGLSNNLIVKCRSAAAAADALVEAATPR